MLQLSLEKNNNNNNHNTFENVQITFQMKNRSTCDISNLRETGEGKTKLRVRDRVRVYRQQIRQPQNQQLKVKEHYRVLGNVEFQVFLLLQMRSQYTNSRQSNESRFQK